MRYRTIVADPPWPYNNPGRFMPVVAHQPLNGSTGSRERYGFVTVESLSAMPIESLAEADAHLYLWTTNAFMEQAHQLARAWGFKPKTIITWGKVHQSDPLRVSMKTGFYFRGATEHVVFCVRGSLPVRGTWPTLFLWPRIGNHSQKPEAFIDLVEQASPGPYIELFSRRHRLGWDVWGDESANTAELVV